MTPEYDVLIVGAGQGGAQSAISLRQNGFSGTIGIIGSELDLPYERPALSKDYLSGRSEFESLLIRPSNFWKEQKIALHLGCEATSVDPETQIIRCDDGSRFRYQKLVWATGGGARKLTCIGHNLAGVHTIRSRSDIDRMKSELAVSRRVIVVGGGYLGLEAAATLNELRKEVVVLEALDRVLARVASEEVSRFFEAEHRARGVELHLSAIVESVIGNGSRAAGVRLAGGNAILGDLIIVAIGILPAVEPLLRAGARGGNGVSVDEACRTTLPNIYAVGDCAEFANVYTCGASMRLESVQNANDQAATVARSIIGKEAPYDAVPWFWSNQFDLKLQTVGISRGYDAVVLRGDQTSRSFSWIYLQEGRLIALDCINATKDFVQGKALVTKRAAIDRALLADASIPLKEMGRELAARPQHTSRTRAAVDVKLERTS